MSTAAPNSKGTTMSKSPEVAAFGSFFEERDDSAVSAFRLAEAAQNLAASNAKVVRTYQAAVTDLADAKADAEARKAPRTFTSVEASVRLTAVNVYEALENVFWEKYLGREDDERPADEVLDETLEAFNSVVFNYRHGPRPVHMSFYAS